MNIILNFLILLLIVSGCSRNNKQPFNPERTYVSVYKAGNATGTCESCLITEVNDFTLTIFFSDIGNGIESCNGSAGYTSDGNNLLRFPETDSEQTTWLLRRTQVQGNSDINCFPDPLELIITRDSANEFNFFFTHNSNEYNMVRQQ